ncbi:hypothetical protein QYE76_061686 [Lolium multiflorum]|uniref:Uncharacterized protein n=1 Tax=Lolium multiflorum TaxID=4521 RepID=A0AAD8S183_LOLMU|nr:hypothetical protein QYE76_061686 [Lolium multiflorum]
MKMAMEMAAVSMEKPSGHFPVPAACRDRDSVPPDLGFAMAAALEAHEIIVLRYMGEMNHIATGTARASMENYSLLMGAAAVMKMAMEMAAVSMEKPSGHFLGPASRRETLSPILASRWRRLWEGFSWFRRTHQGFRDGGFK